MVHIAKPGIMKLKPSPPPFPPVIPIDCDFDPDLPISKRSSFFLGFLELMLGGICLVLAVYVIFFDRNGFWGSGSFQDPFVMTFNATESKGFPSGFLTNLSKVAVSIEQSVEDALWLRMNYTLVHLYVITAACLLLGMSMMVLRGFKGTSDKKLAVRNSAWYPVEGKSMIIACEPEAKAGGDSISTKQMLHVRRRVYRRRLPADDSTYDLGGSSNPHFVALSELLLGLLCLTMALWVLFFDRRSWGSHRNGPTVVAAIDYDGFPATLTVNFASTWMGVSNTLVHLYVMASACLLMGMSLLVMRCWRGVAEFSRVVVEHQEGLLHPVPGSRRFCEPPEEDFYDACYALLDQTPPLASVGGEKA